MQVQSLGQEDPLEKGMAAHSSVLVWKIPWMEEPGGSQSIVLPRVGHDWNNLAHMWDNYLMGNEPRKAGPGSSLWGLTEQLITFIHWLVLATIVFSFSFLFTS